MINILPVWERGYFGEGIRIRINDDGMNTGHSEFEGRFDQEGSCEVAGPSGNFFGNEGMHGTNVAGIAAGGSDDGGCSAGIAPRATLSSCNIFYYLEDEDFSTLSEKLDSFDISQNSWGYTNCRRREQRRERRLNADCPFADKASLPCSSCDFASDYLSFECEYEIAIYCYEFYELDPDACEAYLDVFFDCEYNLSPQEELNSLEEGIINGRDGKGAVYVFAAGNDYSLGVDTNMQSLQQTRYTISVGALGKDRSHSSYSVTGDALFVTAPGGDFESITSMPTASVYGGCTDSGVGTSFAAPVVSGVIALMLEANPELTWRDVQAIIALTSNMVFDDPDDDTRITNAAGYSHSSFYGFGVIDASAAVNASQDWTLLGPEENITQYSGPLDLIISDDATTSVTTTLEIVAPPFTLESVKVALGVSHFSRGDLEILLTSPSNITSILHPGGRPEKTLLFEDDQFWELVTVRNFGESAEGIWTLTVRDIKMSEDQACKDRDYNATFTGRNGAQNIGCRYFEFLGICVDGAVIKQGFYARRALQATSVWNGLNATEACCVCGGGATEEVLRDWQLVLYGTSDDTPSPSSTPSSSPSFPLPTDESTAPLGIGVTLGTVVLGLSVAFFGIYV